VNATPRRVDALAGRAVSRCAASRDYTAAACADSPGVLLLVGSAGGGGGGGGGGGAAADAPPPGVRRVALPVPPEEAAARRAAGDAGLPPLPPVLTGRVSSLLPY
jgi:hypothetical protein